MDFRPQKWSAALTKTVVQLQKKKYRKQEKLFILEGYRAVEQVVQNGSLQVERLLFTDVFVEVVRHWTFMNQLPPKLYQLSAREMKAITTTEQAPGVMALCALPQEESLDQLLEGSARRIVALDRIQDPGNLGTMIRTATWFGVDALLFGEGTVDPYNPKVVRSTAGATAALPIYSADLHQALDQLEAQGWSVYLLHIDQHSSSVADLKLPTDQKAVLVVGNEANGIESSLMNPHRHKIHINGHPQHLIESLNAAVALGIGLHHFS